MKSIATTAQEKKDLGITEVDDPKTYDSRFYYGDGSAKALDDKTEHLYNIEKISSRTFIIILYASTWFFSLYKIYNFSKIGLKIYIYMVIIGFILSILSNLKIFGQVYYFLSLFEHLIIGSIITFSYFSKLKVKFK